MERAGQQPPLAHGAPELIWVFVAAVGAAAIGLAASGEAPVLPLAFGPGLALGALARYRLGNWRLAALVFLLVTAVLVATLYLTGAHPAEASRLGLPGR